LRAVFCHRSRQAPKPVIEIKKRFFSTDIIPFLSFHNPVISETACEFEPLLKFTS
jgi:hypothetical protein